ncbi:MAG: micrococcal nuclease [Chloroflexota bacterium]|nr:micrococcal nuclease [Chloroflexota bacterium]
MLDVAHPTGRLLRRFGRRGSGLAAGVALAIALGGGCQPPAETGTGSTGTGSTAPIQEPGDSGFRPIGPTETAAVVRVVDGDTIVVRLNGQDRRLRYIGMDTPETVKPGSPVEWFGPEATKANRALVEGRTVVLEKDVSETDYFRRLLRYVWLVDGERWTLVDLELVARGFAQVETDPPDVRYADRFLAAQRIARDAGLGLWGPRPSGAP